MFDRFIVATDLSRATFALVTCLGGLKSYGAKHCLLPQCIRLREGATMSYSYQTAPAESRLTEQKATLEKQGPFLCHLCDSRFEGNLGTSTLTWESKRWK